MIYPSYEKYFTDRVKIISPKIAVRAYKRIPFEDGTFVNNNLDFYIKVTNNRTGHDPALIMAFVICRQLWKNLNTNKADYKWMVRHAESHLEALRQGCKESKNVISTTI